MKKTIIVAALFVAALANAQVLNVASVQKLNTPQNVDTKVAGISPAGDFILLTSGSNKGLVRYDIATGETLTLSQQEGAGYNVKVSANGKEVMYRETTYDQNQLRRNNVMRHSFETQKRALIAEGQRDLKHMRFDDRKELSIEDRQLVLTINGNSRIISPNGTNASYIWPSISPDGKKICYYVCGVGCFVANLNGTNPQFIAHDCRAAKWYNNDVIIAMADHDDGEYVTDSKIVAYDLNGNRQDLTDDSMVAMYPYAVQGAIVFATIEGETYLMQIK